MKKIIFILLLFIVGCSNENDPKVLFENGEYEKSFKLWMSRAVNDDRVAQNYVGIYYYLGLGLPRNYMFAKQWFEKAAMNGLADAQYNLGVMYENGEYVEKDYVTAYKWFYIANYKGNTHASRRMQGLADEHKLFPNQMRRAEVLAEEFLD